MSGDYPFAAKIVSPIKCNEKPWDLWVSEIGHLSPRRDEDATFTSPAAVGAKGSASARRVYDLHPYKQTEPRQTRHRRAGVNRLKYETMSLHGLFPQMDTLNAAVCHMCGVIVKCSAAHRHLLESHTSSEPILPPPPPATTLKSRSRHKKEAPPPSIPIDIHPVKMDPSPVHTSTPPLSRVVLPQPELQYLDEASTSSSVTPEVKVCMESGELPVVSIQDTEDLPLGDNITDDIIEIMNSEGIQSADDITNAAEWKNIIRDIGNLQEMNFCPTTDNVQTQDLYAPMHASSLAGYSLTDTDLSTLQFVPNVTSSLLPTVIDTNMINTPVKAAATLTPPSTKSRSKTSKTKFNLREYDPNKHCGVVIAENLKPCTRSLTCKAHALSLRRTVEGRSKPFDTLLAEHRASRDAAAAPAAAAAAAPSVPAVVHPSVAPPAAASISLPPLLVNDSIDLGTFNGLTAEQQVNDIYESLLSVEDPNSVLPDTSGITSLLSQPLTSEPFLMPDDAEITPDVPLVSIVSPMDRLPTRTDEKPDDGPAPLVSTDVCWYSSCPRPLALCTFNASHAGGAITLGKKFATVRSNIKSSLSRSQCKVSGNVNNYYYNQNAMSLTKSVHMNASKCNKPEVRKLIVTCSSAGVAGVGAGGKEMQQTLSELFGGPEVRHALNGHVERRARAPGLKLASGKRAPTAMLDLGFSLDPLLADEKC